ncbi:hypothetical protein BSNN_12590 [Bacillus subtilis subsp. natto]|nr:hypothetical protein BSNN_12590 [Bacillus subtilis subsp. natto]
MEIPLTSHTLLQLNGLKCTKENCFLFSGIKSFIKQINLNKEVATWLVLKGAVKNLLD